MQPARLATSKHPWVQFKLSGGARKTVITGNIVTGALTIEKAPGYAGMIASRDNLDDKDR